MVRRIVVGLTLGFCAAWGAFPAGAEPIKSFSSGFTGNVSQDFNPQTNGNVVVVVDNPNRVGQADPNDVYQASQPDGFTPSQVQSFYNSGVPLDRISGFNIQDVRFLYDTSSDTLAVGVNFFGIAGDAEGNGNPGTYTSPFAPTDPRFKTDPGMDYANLGGHESVTVGLDMNRDGRTDYVVGVPSDKSQAGTGLNGFNFTKRRTTTPGFQPLSDHTSFGTTVPENLGALLFNPSSSNPDFEFTIPNFSKLTNYDPKKGFLMTAYAGNSQDVNMGEDTLIASSPIILAQVVPEPSTVMLWSLAAVGLAWRFRRVKPSNRSVN